MTQRKTRIVCTIGPASNQSETLKALLHAGMNVARLNFSHGTHETHRQTYEALRAAADELGVCLAILQDLCGPKIRLGEVEPDTHIAPGESFELYPVLPGEAPRVGNCRGAGVTYPTLAQELVPGLRVLIDDGKIELIVEQCLADRVVTRVVHGGPVKSKKGVNLPGAVLTTPALTAKDEDDLRFGLQLGVDLVALSFVRKATDLDRAREIMQEVGIKRPLIAKIEKQEALNELEDILNSADGLMVARGDLGIEVALEEVPIVQKHAIRLCQRQAKPVITATQMLETMMSSATPTRAEVTDVANAIFDGTDAVMLSGETASGAFPVQTVQMMDRIARRAEQDLNYKSVLTEVAPQGITGEAVALAACEIAEEVQAKAVLGATVNGTTIRRIAKYRPRSPILALTPDPAMSRQLTLSWGVLPLGVSKYETTDELLERAEEAASRLPWLQAGDRVVIVAGIPLGAPTNLITVRTLKKDA